MTVIEEIKSRLLKYPHVRHEVQDNAIRVHPTSDRGFTISFEEGDSGFTVSYDGWHEHFDNAEQALNCFAFGLSDSCRLKVLSKGGFDYNWAVETKADGEWVEGHPFTDYSVTGLIIIPFWRKSQVKYLQNSLIKGGT